MKLRLVVRVLAVFYAVLWTAGVVSHFLWQRTPPNAAWTAPVFLTCGAALVLLGAKGGRWWLAVVGAAGVAAQFGGTKIALLFGPYSYSGVLQPQVAGVPLAMACAWVLLLGYVKSWLPELRVHRWVAVVAGAVWMTALDVLIDPVATLGLGYWNWHAPGPYYGVPFSNFTGWLVVSAALLAAGVKVRLEGWAPRRLGFTLVVFFGLLAAAHRLTGPAVAAIVLCAWHLWLERRAGGRNAAEPAAG